jgi:hypothetical protein
VDDLYKVKSTTTNTTEKAITKSLLNNLLGRFGLDIYKSNTEIMSRDKYNEICQSKEVLGVHNLDNNLLVNYMNKVNKEICDGMNVDYKYVVQKNLINKEETESTFDNVSIAIASAVTSYARIHMNKIKLNILEKGNKIYYSDTDSIVTDKTLDDSLVGNELGLFKLELFEELGWFCGRYKYLSRAKGSCSVLDSEWL